MAVTTYASAEQYNFDIVKKFSVMALVWAVVGMFVGVYIASELAWPLLNFDSPYISFGRFRPVHTTTVIFGFGGSALFATSYYVVQRTCQTRLISDGMASFTFWGWQAVILLADVSYMLGYTQAREYAEMEWPIDILIEVVWVSYLILFVGTIMRRKQPHIYVANWFYLAFILATALLHTFNNLAVPVDLFSMKSYSLFSGTQDAMTQWWYGHNAVGFFLTAAFLGMMYYFVPKQAGRPIYSYRLSIVHFWALGFMYMWVGAHHLHWTALPDWTSTLAATFSILLLMPSWGGMINGIMTLSGAWDKLRTDPIMRFLIVALSFYGMSTFEGPDDVAQGSERAVALHRLDDRPRPLRRPGLGGDDYLRLAVSHDPQAVGHQAVQHPSGGRAFLAGHHRHPALHHRHVDFGHHPGFDVARLRRIRQPAVFVC